MFNAGDAWWVLWMRPLSPCTFVHADLCISHRWSAADSGCLTHGTCGITHRQRSYFHSSATCFHRYYVIAEVLAGCLAGLMAMPLYVSTAIQRFLWVY